MPDTMRTPQELLSIFADNTTGDISAQDMRDLVLSCSNIKQPPIGNKLRRLAASAAISNAFSQVPYKTAASWVASTAYIAGQVVSNGGNWFVCMQGGTSAASGGPVALIATQSVQGSPIADGTCYWTYIGPAQSTADDPNSPTITVGTSIPGGFTNVIKFNPTTVGTSGYLPNAMKMIGGQAPINNGGYCKINTFNRSASDIIGKRIGFEFETDEDSIAFGMSTNAGVIQLTLDGRRYAPDGFKPGTSGVQIIQVTFPSGRLNHRVRVEYNGASTSGFTNVYTRTNGQIWQPSGESIRAVFISDSIWDGAGYGPYLTGASAPQRIAAGLGWIDPWDFSIGGTGYIAAGSFYTYGQRIPEALTRNPDIWLFMGSGNDAAQTASAITAAATAAFTAIRDGGNTAPIIVLGVWPYATANAPMVEPAVKAAVTARQTAGDNNIYFIPIYGDTQTGLPWLTTSSNNSGDTASVNANWFVSGDGTHPPDAGTAYLARRTVAAIKSQVLPLIP